MSKCLIPKCRRKPTKHHFPIKKSDGGVLTVPLCRLHHNLAEAGDPEIMDLLIKFAPIYWMINGKWSEHEQEFYEWLEEYKNVKSVS